MAYILIVDDDVDICESMASVLRGAGHDVAYRLDGEAGKQALAERHPDLMILAGRFPGKVNAGFELAREIAGMGEDFREMPILMLTAVNKHFPYGFSKEDIDADWLPVSDFVEKPVPGDVLTAKVAGLLSGKGGAAPTTDGE